MGYTSGCWSYWWRGKLSGFLQSDDLFVRLGATTILTIGLCGHREQTDYYIV